MSFWRQVSPANHTNGAKNQSKPNQAVTKLQLKNPKEQTKNCMYTVVKNYSEMK